MKGSIFYFLLFFVMHSAQALEVTYQDGENLVLKDGGESHEYKINGILGDLNDFVGRDNGSVFVTEDKKYVVFTTGMMMDNPVYQEIYFLFKGELIHVFSMTSSTVMRAWKVPETEITAAKCCFNLSEKRIDGVDGEFNFLAVFDYSESNEGLLKKIDYYNVYEFLKYEKADLRKVNDIAYFLYKEGRYEEANIIFQDIVKRFPDRTVAHLNYADNLYELISGKNGFSSDDTKSATQEINREYHLYVNGMKKMGKENLVPEYVYQRLK